jgi:hypothetical protein
MGRACRTAALSQGLRGTAVHSGRTGSARLAFQYTRSEQVLVHGVAHACDPCPERLGRLYGEGPHVARRAGDQHLLARLDRPAVAQALQGDLARHGDYGRLFEGEGSHRTASA